MNPDPNLTKTHFGIWLLWAVALTLFVIVLGTANLENYPLVGGDEIWNMSRSYKLATEGVFGSDMFAGFFNADRHYLIDPPVRHIWQTLSLRLFGAGISQLRWASLLSGLVLLWIVLWLTFRWYGLPVSMLTGLLLVLWRSDLTDLAPGIPFLAVSKSARPDVAAVMWSWVAIGLLYWLLRRPNRLLALCLGAICGLAVLTHVQAAMVLPLVAIVWFWQRGKSAWVDPLSYWIAGGFALVCLPYLAYALFYLSDARGQWFVHEGRSQFSSRGWFLANLLNEPHRFGHLLRLPTFKMPGYHPFGPWLFWFGIVPASVYVWYRALRKDGIGDRILAVSLLATAGLLALFEEIKAPLYTITLVPGICITLALFTIDLSRRLAELEGERLLRAGLGGALAIILVLTMAEGAATYWIDHQRSDQVSPYLEVGQRLGASIPAGAGIAGHHRWWWALHDQTYLSLPNLWLQWRIAAQNGEQSPQFSIIVERNCTEFIIVDPQVRGYSGDNPELLQTQFWDLLARRSTLLDSWTDESYGHLEVYRIESAACP